MTAFFGWLSTNSTASYIFIVFLCSIVIALVVITFVAFFQGRKISFWPPSIGEKPLVNTFSKKTKINKSFSTGTIITPESPQEIREKIENFSELWLLGINLRRMVISSYGLFKERLSKGATLRILLIDPNSDLIPVLAQRSKVHSDPNAMKNSIEQTLHNLTELMSIDNKGIIEVHTLSIVPSYGLIMINPKNSNGQIRVTIYPHKAPPEDNPGFWFKNIVDDKWYKFFIEQFDLLWKISKPFNIRIEN